MRLRSLRIRNFRCFSDQVIEFGNYTVLVGANSAGKSTVLAALNVLFQEQENASTDTSRLEREDFYCGNTAEPVEIVATFDALSEEAVNDLRDYVRHGQLILAAVACFDEASQTAPVTQFGERLGMPEFAPFFARLNDGARVAELREIYIGIRAKHVPDLPPPSTRAAMTDALKNYESQHQERCQPLRSADNFYGARRGRLDKFVQWVYVPAVKDARAEQIEARNSALGKLLARTVRAQTNFDAKIELVRARALEQYEAVLNENQSALGAVAQSLTDKLRRWAHPGAVANLVWRQNADRSVRVDPPVARALVGELDGFVGDVARLGHGMQRSFIFSVLHELAEQNDQSAPTLLLGVEEPELYQHPPQARHLASVLRALANSNSQVVVTTHSPIFAPGDAFESVRLFRRTGNRSEVAQADYASVAAHISQAMGEPEQAPLGVRARMHDALLWSLAEMFFARRIVFVEGPEDSGYINAYLEATGVAERLRRGGVSIIHTASKSGMIRAAAIAKSLGIPYYLVWDADGDVTCATRRAKHARDNRGLSYLSGLPNAIEFPQADVIESSCAIWKDSLAASIREDCGTVWQEVDEEARRRCGYEGDVRKHSLYTVELIAGALDRNVSLRPLSALAEQLVRFSDVEV